MFSFSSKEDFYNKHLKGLGVLVTQVIFCKSIKMSYFRGKKENFFFVFLADNLVNN